MFPEGALSSLEELERLVARGKHEDIKVYWVASRKGVVSRLINSKTEIENNCIIHYFSGDTHKKPHSAYLDELFNPKNTFFLFTNYFHAFAYAVRLAVKEAA